MSDLPGPQQRYFRSIGETLANVATRSLLHSLILHVTMGWLKSEHAAEEPAICWTLARPRVPHSPFSLAQAAWDPNQLCADGNCSRNV